MVWMFVLVAINAINKLNITVKKTKHDIIPNNVVINPSVHNLRFPVIFVSNKDLRFIPRHFKPSIRDINHDIMRHGRQFKLYYTCFRRKIRKCQQNSGESISFL